MSIDDIKNVVAVLAAFDLLVWIVLMIWRAKTPADGKALWVTSLLLLIFTRLNVLTIGVLGATFLRTANTKARAAREARERAAEVIQ